MSPERRDGHCSAHEILLSHPAVTQQEGFSPQDNSCLGGVVFTDIPGAMYAWVMTEAPRFLPNTHPGKAKQETAVV